MTRFHAIKFTLSSHRSSGFHTTKVTLLVPNTRDIIGHYHSESLRAPSLRTLSHQAWISISSATIVVTLGKCQVLGPSTARLGFLTFATVAVKVGRRQVSRPLAAKLGFLHHRPPSLRMLADTKSQEPQQPDLNFLHHLSSQQKLAGVKSQDPQRPGLNF